MIKDNNDGTFSIVAPCSFDKPKPVACIVDDEVYFADEIDWEELQGIPLYTAPRELSDEEIIEVFESPFQPNTTGKINDEVIAFAKAILKKASEK